jgi:hypothetical protein
MKSYLWSGGIEPLILNLRVRWKWLVNIASLSLFPET